MKRKQYHKGYYDEATIKKCSISECLKSLQFQDRFIVDDNVSITESAPLQYNLI